MVLLTVYGYMMAGDNMLPQLLARWHAAYNLKLFDVCEKYCNILIKFKNDFNFYAIADIQIKTCIKIHFYAV